MPEENKCRVQINGSEYIVFCNPKASSKEFLESILTGNILSFAKGMDYHIKERLLVKITHLSKPLSQTFKGQNVLVFNIEFVSNIELPQWIGLGKGSSLGFGTVELK